MFLANAPGNGVADDKAMYCYVPELIAYYLDEHPSLESVPTYRTSDETEARIVLDRVGELVTKPVDGHGGHRRADRSGLRGVRGCRAAGGDRGQPGRLGRPGGGRAVLPSDGRRAPTCSRATWTCGPSSTCEAPRPEDCTLADLALTRVAPEGSLVVNSSRGGGAKDTWIIGEPEAVPSPTEGIK